MNELTVERGVRDEVKVRSGFLKSIISKVISKTLEDKLGKNVRITLNSLEIDILDDAKLHLDLDVKMPKNDLKTLIFEKMGI